MYDPAMVLSIYKSLYTKLNACTINKDCTKADDVITHCIYTGAQTSNFIPCPCSNSSVLDQLFVENLLRIACENVRQLYKV